MDHWNTQVLEYHQNNQGDGSEMALQILPALLHSLEYGRTYFVHTYLAGNVSKMHKLASCNQIVS